jgi:hypothetical protein
MVGQHRPAVRRRIVAIVDDDESIRVAISARRSGRAALGRRA